MGMRSTNAGNNVFALSVGQELAHKTLFAGGGITREGNAGTAIVAHVAERHHLNVDGSTPRVGYIVVHTVNVCSGVVPRTENSLDSFKQLLLRIIREVLADLSLVFSLELVCKGLQIVSIELNVLSNALFFLHLVDKLFKVLLADFHNDVREHLDESSVAVPSPTGDFRTFRR